MQLEAVDAPVTVENVPRGHDWHVVDEYAPTTVEYFPAGHRVQDAAPCCSLYEPGKQLLQLLGVVPPGRGRYVPLWHKLQY